MEEMIQSWGLTVEVEEALEHTADRLPEEVQQFVVERCTFFAVGRGLYGVAIRGDAGCQLLSMLDAKEGVELFAAQPDKRRWRSLILLDNAMSPRDLESVIAHENAHAWRDDASLTSGEVCSKTDQQRMENGAADLVRKWGFKGHGALPFRLR